MFEVEDIFEAYYACLRNKRNTNSAIEFEINYIKNCIELYNDLRNRTYKPSSSIAFIVTKPRLREIFAANFRDRVMHHLIDIHLRPLIEEKLIERTYNNRIGKGTSGCINQLKKDMESAGSSDWICKMDMKGFFMSLSKSLIVEMMTDLIRSEYEGKGEDDMVWLIEKLVMDCPEKYCTLRSPKSMWDGLSRDKSLFTSKEDKGIPIGNLISQLFANYYLNDFDHFMVGGFPKYGRYVDDFYIIGSKEEILKAIPSIRDKLKEVGVTLHPHKFYLQHVSKGCEMLGTIVRPNRVYRHNRTVYSAFSKVEKMTGEWATQEDLSTVNSYLGLMKGYNTYKIRRRLAIKAMRLKGFSAPNTFHKMILKTKDYGNRN